jgi:hypothetical protein
MTKQQLVKQLVMGLDGRPTLNLNDLKLNKDGQCM